jgi:hypothetical protein
MKEKEENKPTITIPQMLQRLDQYYAREAEVKREIILLSRELQKIQEDIQMMEMLISFRANRVIHNG